jgi:hypothetical protein
MALRLPPGRRRGAPWPARRRGKRVAVLEPAAYGGYKDASAAWVAGGPGGGRRASGGGRRISNAPARVPPCPRECTPRRRPAGAARPAAGEGRYAAAAREAAAGRRASGVATALLRELRTLGEPLLQDGLFVCLKLERRTQPKVRLDVDLCRMLQAVQVCRRELRDKQLEPEFLLALLQASEGGKLLFEVLIPELLGAHLAAFVALGGINVPGVELCHEKAVWVLDGLLPALFRSGNSSFLLLLQEGFSVAHSMPLFSELVSGLYVLFVVVYCTLLSSK